MREFGRKVARLGYPLQILFVAVLYFGTGRLGLLLAIPPGYASPIWPPSGIALAAALLWGGRVWPGIILGSFCVNVGTSFAQTGGPSTAIAVALSIGVGAALQALAGAWLVRRFVGFPSELSEPAAVLKFLAFAGPVSCLVNATWSVTTLCLAAIVPWAGYPFNWATWWVGDAIGAMVVTPLAFIWVAEPRDVWRRRRVGAVPLAAEFAAFVVVFFIMRSPRAYLTGNPALEAWTVLAGGLLFTAVLGAFLLVVTGRSETIRASLAEKEALLNEIHHRVKNNLEVINSLLSLQADFVSDPSARQMLEQTCNRVRAIADIHHMLYRSPDLARVDFGAFLRGLSDSLFSLYNVGPERVRLLLDVDRTLIEVEEAVPFGLIVNELLCNALKHAFPGNRVGVIQVRMDWAGGLLVVADDGVGLPPGLDPETASSLGLQLVQVLVEQIHGTIEVGSGPGARFTIAFPAAVVRSAIPTPR